MYPSGTHAQITGHAGKKKEKKLTSSKRAKIGSA